MPARATESAPRKPMIRPAFIACAALLLLPAVAQSFTSPLGFEFVEGDEAHFALLNSSYQKFMQIDDTLRGSGVQDIRAIGFRRDGDRVSASGGPRSLDLTVMMGHADYASISGTFATNYKQPPTTVFTRKTVNTPDWSSLAAIRPAPFDFNALFDVKWSYNGSDALVWELHMENVSQTGSPNVDREIGTSGSFTQTFGTTRPNSFGCLVAGFGLEMSHTLFLQNYGPSHPQFGMRIGSSVDRAPRNQPTVLNIDLVDPNLALGLCANVHALPLVSLSLGTTNANGFIDVTWTDIPHARQLEGIRFHTQALTLDPNRPVVPISLSEDRSAAMPPAPRPAPRAAYVYAPSVTTSSATLWPDRGVIARFQY
jgi:hypothetical protein